MRTEISGLNAFVEQKTTGSRNVIQQRNKRFGLLEYVNAEAEIRLHLRVLTPLCLAMTIISKFNIHPHKNSCKISGRYR